MSDFRAEDHRLTNPAYSRPESEGTELAPPLGSERVQGVVSFLSSTEREGRWELPRRFRALAVMGNVELDLRAADVGYGLSVIEAVAVMGNIEITVPPEIAVECDGDSFLGAFTLKYHGRASPSSANRERTLRVTGSAYAGAVTVSVKGRDDKNIFERLRRNQWGMEE
ncbi:MAG TPA: LiaF domain-containing protein [Gemmatimonadaceae bacterium]|nr:LiaF domain-containing protein [Gemmatimonadaceae bacterium]